MSLRILCQAYSLKKYEIFCVYVFHYLPDAIIAHKTYSRSANLVEEIKFWAESFQIYPHIFWVRTGSPGSKMLGYQIENCFFCNKLPQVFSNFRIVLLDKLQI